MSAVGRLATALIGLGSASAGCGHPRVAGCAFDDHACVERALCARTWPPNRPVRFGSAHGDYLTVSVDDAGRARRVTWHLEMRPGQYEALGDPCPGT